MEAYLFDWLSLLGRWLHLIAGIAWIGASFYFVWLDNHLLAPQRLDPASVRFRSSHHCAAPSFANFGIQGH